LTPAIVFWKFKSPPRLQFPKWKLPWECEGSFHHTFLHFQEHEVWLPSFLLGMRPCKSLPWSQAQCLGCDIFFGYNVVTKPNRKTQDVLLCFLNDYMYGFSHKLFQWILYVKKNSHILMNMWLINNEVVTRWWVLIFITFISFIWHPWLMTKWHGCPIVITMIKKWLQIIWYEHKQTYPPTTYLPSP
jgi:hypothetical protein